MGEFTTYLTGGNLTGKKGDSLKAGSIQWHLLKPKICCHCEERNDEAISIWPTRFVRLIFCSHLYCDRYTAPRFLGITGVFTAGRIWDGAIRQSTVARTSQPDRVCDNIRRFHGVIPTLGWVCCVNRISTGIRGMKVRI
jgi:hypothetical protein